MNDYKFFSAQPIGNQSIPSIRIWIAEPFPDFSHTGTTNVIRETARVMDEQADQLAAVLFNTLPQGVINRLVAKMMEHNAGYLRINERLPQR